MSANKEGTVPGSATEPVYTRLQRGLKRVEIDGQTFYVAEGDLLLDESQLPKYALERAAATGPAAAAAAPAGDDVDRRVKLLGMMENGKIVRWKPGLVLTYCVLKNTFADADKYQLARNSMQQAVWAWESTCGVKFEHKAELDDSPTNNPEGVLFPVREFNALGRFIAAAFFPNDPVNRRQVFIDPSYYTTGFDKVGVLRHELGHVLGFRHEHIRSGAPPACGDEDTGDTVELSEYDPQSVMHYFCGGVGSRDLQISELDRAASRRVYGPPLNEISFFE